MTTPRMGRIDGDGPQDGRRRQAPGPEGEAARMEEQIRRIVTSAVGEAHPSPLRYYHVCHWQNGIRCLHPRHTRRAHPVFLTVAGEVLATGLSPRQWKVLTRRIIYICRMTGLHNRQVGS